MEQFRANQEGGNELNTTAMWLSASVKKIFDVKKENHGTIKHRTQLAAFYQRKINTRHKCCKNIFLEGLKLTPHM